MKIAIVGAGISGLGAAQSLMSCGHDVTVFEKADVAGGHAHTVDIVFDNTPISVDVGFIVYNTLNYPRLTQLFADLDVETEDSDMSFSVHRADGRLEWGGDGSAVFAQKSNIFRLSFWRMLIDIVRFNKRAKKDLVNGTLDDPNLSLGDYLDSCQLSQAFSNDYLLPMGAAIWSSPISEMRQFPARSFVQFFENHCLLNINDRPIWRTVTGGSRNYVNKITSALGPKLVTSAQITQITRQSDTIHIESNNVDYGMFDRLIIATHGDDVLHLLSDADDQETAAFKNFRTQPNVGYLHSSETLMPKRRKAWSSWNYRVEQTEATDTQVSVTYWMNRLQSLDPSCPIFLSLNPLTPPPAEQTFQTFTYSHPLYDEHSPAGQDAVTNLQGHRNTWYAGAYLGHGFHEDGLRTGQLAAESVMKSIFDTPLPKPGAAA